MSLIHWCFSAIDVVAPVLVCADRKAVPVAARTERAVYGPDAIVVMGRLSNAIQCRYLVYLGDGQFAQRSIGFLCRNTGVGGGSRYVGRRGCACGYRCACACACTCAGECSSHG